MNMFLIIWSVAFLNMKGLFMNSIKDFKTYSKGIKKAHQKVNKLLNTQIFNERNYGYDYEIDDYFLQSFIKHSKTSIKRLNDFIEELEIELPNKCANEEINCMRIGVTFEDTCSLYYPMLLQILLTDKTVLDYKFIGSYKPAKILYIVLLKKYIGTLKKSEQRYSKIKNKADQLTNLFSKSVKLYKISKRKKALEERLNYAIEELTKSVNKLEDFPSIYLKRRRIISTGDESSNVFNDAMKIYKDITKSFVECFKFLNLELVDLKKDGNFNQINSNSNSGELSFYINLPKFKNKLLSDTINEVEIEILNIRDIKDKIQKSNISMLPNNVKISKQNGFVNNMDISEAYRDISKILKRLYHYYFIEIRDTLSDKRDKIAFLNNQLVVQKIVLAYEKLSKDVKLMIVKLIDILES